jgi:hypothetical protein
VFRALCGPALVVAERSGASGTLLAGLVLLAFLSDVFDGVIARHSPLSRCDHPASWWRMAWAAASMILSQWHHDVPTVWHAARIELASTPSSSR